MTTSISSEALWDFKKMKVGKKKEQKGKNINHETFHNILKIITFMSFVA